jgi:hypothetical protein
MSELNRARVEYSGWAVLLGCCLAGLVTASQRMAVARERERRSLSGRAREREAAEWELARARAEEAWERTYNARREEPRETADAAEGQDD